MSFNNYIFLSILLFSLLLVNCNIDRNKLEFSHSELAIEDSIIKMNYILEKNYSDLYNISYAFNNENFFYLNGKKLMNVNGFNEKEIRYEKYGEIEKKCLKLALFLKSNSIMGCHRDNISGCFFYDYKPTKKYEYEDLRYVVYDNDLSSLESEYENIILLDKKRKLYLFRFEIKDTSR